MQKFIPIAIFFLFSFFVYDTSLHNIQKVHFFAPFQGKRDFCSTERNEKIIVSIKANHVNIIIGERKISGTYKTRKILLTNDPGEIEYRKNAPSKYHYGNYYVIEKDHLSIDRKSTRLNSSHLRLSRMPSSA